MKCCSSKRSSSKKGSRICQQLEGCSLASGMSPSTKVGKLFWRALWSKIAIKNTDSHPCKSPTEIMPVSMMVTGEVDIESTAGPGAKESFPRELWKEVGLVEFRIGCLELSCHLCPYILVLLDPLNGFLCGLTGLCHKEAVFSPIAKVIYRFVIISAWAKRGRRRIPPKKPLGGLRELGEFLRVEEVWEESGHRVVVCGFYVIQSSSWEDSEGICSLSVFSECYFIPPRTEG